MNFDFTVSIPAIITLAGISAAAIAAWTAVRWRITSLEASTVLFTASLKVANEHIEQIRANVAHELADFKLVVAKDYATNNAVLQMEERIASAIDRLGDRLDKLIDAQGRRNTSRTSS
jgi:predicted RNA-binding protein with PIN domain